MPKSKAGPALFELYGKGKTKSGAPGVENRASQTPGMPVAEQEAETASSSPTGAEQEASAGYSWAATSDAGDARPWVSLRGGRLHLALTSRATAIAVFILLLLACVCFAAGQWAGRRAGWADGRVQGRLDVQRPTQDQEDDGIEQARTQPPAENLFGDNDSPIRREHAEAAGSRSLPELPRPAPAGEKSTTTWIKGHTYVLIQEFRHDAGQDALRAKQFLAANGIEAEIFGAAGRGFRLFGTKGFNRKDPKQRDLADRYLENIRRLGKEYFKAGGQYKLEGYFATLKSDTW